MIGDTSPFGVYLAPLRPDWVIEAQQTYFSAVEAQLFATVVIVAAIALALTAGRRLEDQLLERYGRQLAEISRVLWLLFVLVGGVYSLSVVWRATYLIQVVLDVVAIDRWTATQQLITVATVLAAYLLMRFINRSIDKLADASSITQHQSEVAYHVADVGIAGAAATVILTIWGIDLTNIFIGAGAITAIVGLAARETLAAMIAGFVLLFSRPFRIGDWIEINDSSGIVTDVTIFNTKIQTFGDEYVLIPNDQITSSQLTNLSRNDQLRVEIDVGIDYDTDIQRARSIAVDAVSDLESIKSSPAPEAVAKRFADSSILLELRVWIANPTMRRRWDARTDAIEAIKEAFDREGITIPYPQRVQSARGEGLPIEGTGTEHPASSRIESE